jgi:hypothetical protein
MVRRVRCLAFRKVVLRPCDFQWDLTLSSQCPNCGAQNHAPVFLSDADLEQFEADLREQRRSSLT